MYNILIPTLGRDQKVVGTPTFWSLPRGDSKFYKIERVPQARIKKVGPRLLDPLVFDPCLRGGSKFCKILSHP